MQVKVIFVLILLTILVSLSVCFPTQNSQVQNISSGNLDLNPVPSNHQPITSKLEELASQRTESIRQIIAAEQKKQEQSTTGLSEVSSHGKKLEKSLVDIDEERFPTLEELRAKCEHYSRLFGSSPVANPLIENFPSIDIVERHPSTVLPPRSEFYNRPTVVEVTRRPVYIRNKPTFIEKTHGGFYVTAASTGNEVTTTKKNYFWVRSHTTATPSSSHTTTATRSSPSTTFSTTEKSDVLTKNNTDNGSTTQRPKIKIKYTKYEPVILQKTILTDGRVLYHWHKSLPTAALDLPAPITPIASPILPTYEYPSDLVPAVVPVIPPIRNFEPIIEPITVEPTTTTTTERSSWLFVPFSGLFGGSREDESSTVETSTASPSTSSSTTTAASNILDASSTLPSSSLDLSDKEDTKLQQQLKFIVPINYDDIDSKLDPQIKPWDYNRIPYKGQRGTNTVVQPNYQIIKSLAIPQSIPRYSLGYTGAGYGLTFANGVPYNGYGSTYGAGYGNYQGYERENKKIDDVSL